MRTRVLIALFVAYVLATAIHVAYVTHHEPFAFDAWNVAVDTRGEPASASRFFAFWWDQYTHSNPRIGQELAYFAYKLEYFAPIATALAFLALSLAVTVLGLGRFPRGGRDLAMWAIAIGFAWFVLPQIGRNMFCRAYAANYVYTAAITLWFLVPLRFAHEASIPKCIAYGLAGVIVGACNEHTGPTLVVFLLGYAFWLRRHGHMGRLVLSGFLGVMAGFAAIFFAPGQDQRYGELAQSMSLPARLLRRGIVNNLDILRDYVIYAAPLAVLLVIVMIVAHTGDETRRRGALRLLALVLGAGVLMSVTLFVSPKLGSRFYLVSMALLLVGFIAVADAVLTARQLVPFVVLAAAASIYAGARTVPLYRSVAAHGAERIAQLEAAPPGSELVVDALDQVGESWWYIGDDMDTLGKRELVASYLGLRRILYRGHDLERPLGLTGISIVPSIRVGASWRPFPGFDLGDTTGFDVKGMQRAAAISLDLLLQHEHPDAFELEVVFAGTPPPLPRKKLLLARWQGGTFEAYSAELPRKSLGRRDVVAKDVAGKELYVLRVGDPPHRLDGTSYTPWRDGVYWILACDPDACFVIAATRRVR